MAELYYQQGHVKQAIETYRRIVERDPTDDSAQARLDELEMMAGVRREIPIVTSRAVVRSLQQPHDAALALSLAPAAWKARLLLSQAQLDGRNL